MNMETEPDTMIMQSGNPQLLAIGAHNILIGRYA